MTCPHCASAATLDRPDRTELGYRRFRCRDCKRVCNERTGTPFNRLAISHRCGLSGGPVALRYKLSRVIWPRCFSSEASCSRMKPCGTGNASSPHS